LCKAIAGRPLSRLSQRVALRCDDNAAFGRHKKKIMRGNA
jgi:hypothetical protein